MSTRDYEGNELELFADARNWKSYFSRQIKWAIQGDVLEVGAGIGTTTLALHHPDVRSWTALEPDESLAVRLRETIVAAELSAVDVCVGVIDDAIGMFDTILYIDVLEHIEDDALELKKASERLRPGGRIVVLAPAYQWLYSAFDRAIGHHRRYSRKMIKPLSPRGLVLERCFYLDTAGLFASAANRVFLRSSRPSKAQIGFWDRVLVPTSRLIDPLFARRFGKSIVATWLLRE